MGSPRQYCGCLTHSVPTPDLPVHQLVGPRADRVELMLLGTAELLPAFARVHDRLAVEHADDQVGVELFEEDVDGVAIDLLGAVHGPEDVGPARAGVLAMDAVQAPGHIGGGHLAIAPLKLHALAQVEAIALAIIQDVIGVGQGFRRIIQPILAHGHQHFIAGIEVHAIEGARGLEAVRTADLTEVGDVQGGTGGLVGERPWGHQFGGHGRCASIPQVTINTQEHHILLTDLADELSDPYVPPVIRQQTRYQ